MTNTVVPDHIASSDLDLHCFQGNTNPSSPKQGINMINYSSPAFTMEKNQHDSMLCSRNMCKKSLSIYKYINFIFLNFFKRCLYFQMRSPVQVLVSVKSSVTTRLAVVISLILYWCCAFYRLVSKKLITLTCPCTPILYGQPAIFYGYNLFII